MAINTETKRRSVQHIFPVPDGTIAAPDRAQAAGYYARAGGSPSVPLPVDIWTVVGAPRVLSLRRES